LSQFGLPSSLTTTLTGRTPSTRPWFCSRVGPHSNNVPLIPVRRGFKVWVRADSTNGYISDFAVYTGKEGEVEKDLGAKVAKNSQSHSLEVDTTSFSTITFRL
jgi:hypothetical protein